MKRLDWFKFYPRDFFTSQNVAMMTCFERGVYLQLLGHCWIQSDCSLPADDVALARILGLSTAEWRQVKPAALQNFKLRRKRLVNNRLLEQRGEAIAATKHAQAGNEAKKNKRRLDGGLPGESPGALIREDKSREDKSRGEAEAPSAPAATAASAASPLSNVWKILGIKPVGTPAFRTGFETTFAKTEGNLVERLEEVIQACQRAQVPVPPQIFQRKRELELERADEDDGVPTIRTIRPKEL